MNIPPISLCIPSSRLLLRPSLRSLSHTANSHWLPILYVVMYISMLLSLYIVKCLFDICFFLLFRFFNELLLFFIFQIVESPWNGPKGLAQSISPSLSKIFNHTASSVFPESSKFPPAPRPLRSTSPSLEYCHPHPMANLFLLNPEVSVFCYFSRGDLSTHIINQEDRFSVEFVLTTPKSFYRIHTKIGSCLIFFFYCLLVDC